MSLNITRSYGTVWQVEVEDRYVKANVSTSDKNPKAENGREYMSWPTRFVGEAFEKAKELEPKDRIVISSAKVKNHYNKEEGKVYNTLVVFDFEKFVPEETAAE